MVIDRIEGSVAVVEFSKGHFGNVALDSINGRARDGAVLVMCDGGYSVDEGATAARAASIEEKRKRLFRK